MTTPDVRSPRIHVGIVTYGDRGALLERVLDALEGLDGREAIDHIHVVDNASSLGTRERLRARCERDARLVHHPLPRNVGSAGGVRHLIDRLLQEGNFDAVWLLDDDNVPEPGALTALLDAWSQDGERDATALASVRVDRPAHARRVSGATVRATYGSRSSFLGFHVLDVVPKIVRRMAGRTNDVPGRLPIPYAPYGGLFVPAALLRRVDPPDPAFFTYADDTDFTFRLRETGGTLDLVRDSRIRDVDASWDAAMRLPLPVRLVRGESVERVAYMVRNTAFFSRHRWRTHAGWYALNRMVFLAMVSVSALVSGRPARLALLLRAVRAGERGALHVDPTEH